MSSGDAASVSGRVSSPGPKTDIPIAGVMVTLHRVGTDTSGPVDSVRTDAAGRYALRYHRFGASDAVYFAAAVWRGIAYFSAPLKSHRASGEEGEITVFDTTSRAVEFHVRGHHFVISGPRPDAARNIVEVWELSNDTTATVVGRDSLSPVWSASLPPGAADFAGGQGDVSPTSVEARSGRVVLVAPFGPGVKQISYSYSLPPKYFPLDLRLERPTVVLEVLVEEPGAQVSGADLRSMPAATTSGRTFKRFLAQDVPAGSVVHITTPITTEATRTKVLWVLAAVIALIMAGALTRALTGRRSAAHAQPVPVVKHAESLVAAIAHLDARKESGDTSLDDATYAANRAALKHQLAAALAAGERVP
ncbi:MAG: carboxypeptidase-like regulatory domain-containing protein [bacterium]